MKRIFSNQKNEIFHRNRQTVFDDSKIPKKNVHIVSQWYAFSVVALIIALGAISKHLLFQLPKEILVEELKDNPGKFISERAWMDLKTLTNIGPRTAGSYENEVLGVNFLKTEISKIQLSANPAQKVQTDLQIVSGGYFLGFKPQGMTTIYRNIQNVVVKLSGSSDSNSLLLNCHFDTVPGSPGASDDGGSCVVMLEVLRILSREKKMNKHSIIFLFNGAEETSLQASHGFITQHPWSSSVRAFINIESAGSNGKEILFQTGPNHSWLVDMYRRSVPHPFGNSVGEELFQSGLIPSDTDFRIFRDFGKIPGLDLAHPMNGYRYHTKYDDIRYIPMSCLQRSGDNVLEIVRSIANSEELNNIKAYEDGVNIYFDVLGFVFVSYSRTVGMILNILVGVFSVIVPYFTLRRTTRGIPAKYIRKQMLIGFFCNIFALILSAVASYVIASELDFSGNTMSWYKNPIFAVLLYIIPVGLVFSIVHGSVRTLDSSPLSLSLHVQARLLGTNLMWSALLLASIAFDIRSAYMILIPSMVSLVSNTIIGLTGIQNSIRKWLYVHLFHQLMFTLWVTSCFHLLTGVFIPLIGRSGGEKNPEIPVAVICLFFTIYGITYIAPLIQLLNKRRLIFISLIATFFITRCVLSFTYLGFPYNDSEEYPTPQRHYISHTMRTVFDENGQEIYSDSGFWARQVDRNTKKTIESLFAPEIPILQTENIACSKTIFCGLPFHSMRHLYSTGYWIPGPMPLVRDEASLTLTSTRWISKNEKEMKFTLNGNVLLSLGIQAKPGVELVDWDITDKLSSPNEFLGQRVYLIAVTNGLDVKPMNFTLKFKIDDAIHKGVPIIDMMLVSYYWDKNTEYTPYFKDLLNKLPSWTFTVPSVSLNKSWTF